jgi:peptidyl-prolyl cis-trans isomerase D
LGTSPALMDNIFHLRAGDLSAPIQTDKGIVVLSVKDVQPSHAATLPEVHDQVASDYRHDKAVELAKTRAEEFAKRAKAGENFAAAAKSLGFEVKSSEPFSRTGSLPDAGSARQLTAAFNLPAGQSGDAVAVGANWLVYRVAQHDPVSMDGFDKQKAQIQSQLLQQKRQSAYSLFRTALKNRLQQEGKVKLNQDNLKRLITPA